MSEPDPPTEPKSEAESESPTQPPTPTPSEAALDNATIEASSARVTARFQLQIAFRYLTRFFDTDQKPEDISTDDALRYISEIAQQAVVDEYGVRPALGEMVVEPDGEPYRNGVGWKAQRYTIVVDTERPPNRAQEDE